MTERIALISLGCEKNMVNSEQMLWLLKNEGYTITGELDGADAVILNTCGFIDSAKSEAIDHIIELGELKKAGKIGKIIVCGCLSERYKDEIFGELPEVDGIVGCGGFGSICEAVRDAIGGGTPSIFGSIDAEVEETPRLISTPAHYAYLKIAEGCDNRCAYCVIPSLRGKYRSRPFENIMDEARLLASGGVKELILIAQDTSRYGLDIYGNRRLAELLRELCKIEALRWLRIHYLYPDAIDDELISVIASEDKIVKYLDIPIQHVNDGILKAMNRRGDKGRLTALFKELRAKIPGLVLRTSVICGLPGETEREFEELCDFLREHKLERVGAFAYSPEDGTPAALMPDRCSGEEAQRRAAIVSELQARVMDTYNEAMIGKTIDVLCEGYDGDVGCYFGRSYADSPEVDGRVRFTSAAPAEAGQLLKVKITGADGDLTGIARN